MKKVCAFLVFMIFALNLAAQKDAKNDIILKVNGDELNGKITEMGDAEVKFVYAGETLVYAIKKTDILKITYASGRIEFFNKQPLPSEKKEDTSSDQKANSGTAPQKSTVDHRNRIAILPFHFITDRQSAGDEMSYKVQNECYTYLSKHAGELTIVDPRTTNALLIKGGVTTETIRGFTMDEICFILGVEYIIDGTITQNKGQQYSTQNQNYKVTEKNDNKSGNNNNAKVTGSSTATTIQTYETSISMNIYTDKNTNIFSEDRKSFWSTDDAYKNSLQYLLKKCPLYRK